MGSFDEFVFACPACHEDVIVQTKADECDFQVYDVSNVTQKIISDLAGTIEVCYSCSRQIIIVPVGQTLIPFIVPKHQVYADGDDND